MAETRTDRYRAELDARVREELGRGEGIVAMLPFATIPRLPRRGPGRSRGRRDKVRYGLRQSWNRYRPTVLTDRRLLVFDSGRTPSPRTLLEAFPVESIRLLSIDPPRLFGAVRVVLDLPGHGAVPYDTGRKERADVEMIARVLGPVGSDD